MASAMIWPMSASELAEMAPTWAISLLVVVGRAGDVADFGDDGDNRLVDAALEVGGVITGRHILEAFADDGLGQHGGGGGAVTGVVGGARGDFLHQLGADVLVFILELDFLGDGNTVLGYRGGAEGALQHHVAAFRAEGHLDGVGEDVDTGDDAGAGVVAKQHFLCGHSDSS